MSRAETCHEERKVSIANYAIALAFFFCSPPPTPTLAENRNSRSTTSQLTCKRLNPLKLLFCAPLSVGKGWPEVWFLVEDERTERERESEAGFERGEKEENQH